MRKLGIGVLILLALVAGAAGGGYLWLRTSLPTVDGTVTWVSADRLTDSNSGEEYYTARVDLKDQNDPRLNGLKLQPGMPAEILIRTGERTLIQYLVSPVEQSISRSLRE